MSETTIKDIKPSLIIFDAGTQARTKTDTKTCEAYIESMKDGDEFPPLDVFSDGTSENYILADGFHRLQSHMSFQPNKPIRCRVHFGTLEDAQWFAITANKTHGLRRTNEDKRKAVKMALLHNKSQDENLSDRAIADAVGVDHKTVGFVREKLGLTGEIPQSKLRKGKDGRVIDTAKIGQKPVKYPHLNEPPEPESNIRTNADGKEVNIKSFDFKSRCRCEQCDNWDVATGKCECDDSQQWSWTPGCDDWVKRINGLDDAIDVVQLRTNKRNETTRTNTEKSHYVREEHISCKIYTQNPQLTAVELRTLLGEEYLFRLREAIDTICDDE